MQLLLLRKNVFYIRIRLFKKQKCIRQLPLSRQGRKGVEQWEGSVRGLDCQEDEEGRVAKFLGH